MKCRRILRPSVLLLSWLGLLSAPASWASEVYSFLATLSNASSGQERCVGFGHNGEGTFPERLAWDGSGPCGLGDREELLRNRQAVWRFTPIGNGEYVLENASQEPGSYSCLLFDDNGSARYPERYSWGPGEACGYPGGVEALRLSRMAVWRLNPLGDDLYTLVNSSRNAGGECLIFGGNGQSTKPERHNWGLGDFCGFPGGRDALLQNRQAVFKIERIELDSEPVPEAWQDGYIMLQNALLPNQVLGADPAGYGPARAEWWHEDNARFDLKASDEGRFFFLENARSGKRLHVGHNGDGQLYSAFAGGDDAYKWFLEESGYSDRFLFRSKLFPDQKLAVALDGTGHVAALSTPSPNEAHTEWFVTTAESPTSHSQLSFERFGEIEGAPLRHYELIFQNKMYPHQRLHVGHDGNGLLYAEDGPYEDVTYRWIPEYQTDGTLRLRSRASFDQRLFATPGGQPTARPGGAPELYRWELEPAPGNWFFLRNPETDKRLHVGHDGNGELYAAAGQYDDAYQWHLLLFEGGPRFFSDIGETTQCPSDSHHFDLSIKLCLYDGFDQTGYKHCQIYQEVFELGEPKFIQKGISALETRATRSISIEDCNHHDRPPTALLFDQGDPVGAEGKYRRARQIMAEIFGEGTLDVAVATSRIASALRDQGKLEQAEALDRSAISQLEAMDGDWDMALSNPTLGLGRTLRLLGRLDEAEQMIRRALALDQAMLPQDHWQRLETEIDLARVLADRGQEEKARLLLASVLDRNLGPESGWIKTQAGELLEQISSPAADD